jgi:hypothetical protein
MVVEHLEEPSLVFAELARVLDESGHLIIHTPNAAGYFIRTVRFGRRILPDRWIVRLIRFLEHREDQDVYPTYYRANTASELQKLTADVGLEPAKLQLLYHRPLFYFIAPMSATELLLTRLMRNCGLTKLGATTILGTFRPVRKFASEQRRRATAAITDHPCPD